MSSALSAGLLKRSFGTCYFLCKEWLPREPIPKAMNPRVFSSDSLSAKNGSRSDELR